MVGTTAGQGHDTAAKRTTSGVDPERSAKAKEIWARRKAEAKANQAPKDAFGSEAPIVNRPKAKPVARPPMRGVGQAVSLDGELVTRRRTLGDEGITNPFDIPQHLRRHDYVTQGVRASIFGQPDHQNLNNAHLAGWRAVTVKHYPGAFPDLDAKGPDTVIERDGIVLMARHVSLEEEALVEQHRDAVALRETTNEMFGERKFAEGFEKGRRSGNGKFDASKMIRRTREASPAEFRPKHVHATPADED